MKMKRLLLAVLLLTAYMANGWACTNFIVGKKASADGSVIVSYSADSYGMFGYLCHFNGIYTGIIKALTYFYGNRLFLHFHKCLYNFSG